MEKQRVVLVDLSALYHPAWRSNETGHVSVAFEATIGGVNRIAKQFPDALMAICADGKGNWRKDISADYKAQRDRLPDLFYEQFAKVKQRLRDDGRLLWQFDSNAEWPGFEADDVIGTARNRLCADGHQVTIATHDKDLFQLVQKDVCDVLSLSTWEIRTEADVTKKFGVEPPMIADFLALTGDSSDNVPGCPGCGPVNAAKLLNGFGSLERILSALAHELVDSVGPSLAGKIATNREQIRLSRQLVALRLDVPIDFAEIYQKRDAKEVVALAVPPVEQAILETGLAAKMGAGVQYLQHADAGYAGLASSQQETGLQFAGSQKNLDEQQYFGFSGAGAEPFPEHAVRILGEPVSELDVEIRADGLVFLSGAFYRRQLTRAFGPGGWALLPRSRPMAADGVVVWHGALVCLGRFVSESFGEKEFQARNGNDSYPNAAEAAKTDCLRRCVKDLGWSWELWSKEWTEAWKKKHAEQYRDNGKDKWRKK